MLRDSLFEAGRDPRSVPEYTPRIPGESSDPDFIHRTDKYDADYIWDGESMDEEKT